MILLLHNFTYYYVPVKGLQTKRIINLYLCFESSDPCIYRNIIMAIILLTCCQILSNRVLDNYICENHVRIIFIVKLIYICMYMVQIPCLLIEST